MKGLVILGFVVLLAVAVLVPMLQGTVAEDASFDFGNEQEFAGVLVKDPVPMLVGDDDEIRFLVNPLKFGFDEQVAEKFHLKHVVLQGTLIARGDDEMVEERPESVVPKRFASSTASLMMTPVGVSVWRIS